MFIQPGTQGNPRGLMIPNVMMRPRGVMSSAGYTPRPGLYQGKSGAGIKGLLLQQDARYNLPALCGLLSGSQSQNLID